MKGFCNLRNRADRIKCRIETDFELEKSLLRNRRNGVFYYLFVAVAAPIAVALVLVLDLPAGLCREAVRGDQIETNRSLAEIGLFVVLVPWSLFVGLPISIWNFLKGKGSFF